MSNSTGRFARIFDGGFRGFIQGKTRIVSAWIFVVIAGYLARRMPAWPGLSVAFLGASLRFWASGYLRKDSRPAVGGPYAWVRNPLYLGTYLMALGTVWSIGADLFLVILSIFYAVLYHFIILDEETKLRKIFGEPYLLYCMNVSRFFPLKWKASTAVLTQVNPDLTQHPFNWELAMKNKAYEAYVSFLGLWGVIWLSAYAWHSSLR